MRPTHIIRLALPAALAGALLAPAAAPGEIRSVAVEYADGEAVLEGYVAYDAAARGKRPGVLVIHEWWGLNDYARARTRQLAAMGYVAFAADIYGQGRRAATRAEAAQLAGPFRKDRALLRRRAACGLALLRRHELVDADKLAAIGFCFGGTAVLELARSGADLAAAVSFHGGLGTPRPASAGQIRAKILVLHGADDPGVPADEVAAFQAEMRSAKADWQMVFYGGTVHAFTNPAAGDDASRGAAYDERAARRSWTAMQTLFAETIGLPTGGVRDDGGKAGLGRFAKEKIAEPVVKAGKATGKAVKKAATWTWDKLRRKDD